MVDNFPGFEAVTHYCIDAASSSASACMPSSRNRRLEDSRPSCAVDVNRNSGKLGVFDVGLDRFDHDTQLALLAYNRGPTKVTQILARGGDPIVPEREPR